MRQGGGRRAAGRQQQQSGQQHAQHQASRCAIRKASRSSSRSTLSHHSRANEQGALAPSGFAEAEPVQQAQARGVARIDIGDHRRQPMHFEPAREHCAQRLRRETKAPASRMQDQADLGEAVEAGLADHHAVLLDDEILALAARMPRMAASHSSEFRDAGMRRMRPIGRRHGVTQYRVHRDEVFRARRPQRQPGGMERRGLVRWCVLRLHLPSA